ncbi:hypothetical protein N476_05290 [Pseudoalteromonas luteoviolacea H33]|uniref:Uncharacterized protein n=1 Tax=Pseudoalteromonas luteoviolacea H33 TaxID=1365251 RepID=A0A167AIN6_9GAMM|nr:hypothetical protein N476_05290 [Pseudoalteromonas luteoviolacea H33]KZN70702.1 hypothetical protein N477_04750 [Pseudoalteromonas luteoviolacea H33-S]
MEANGRRQMGQARFVHNAVQSPSTKILMRYFLSEEENGYRFLNYLKP